MLFRLYNYGEYKLNREIKAQCDKPHIRRQLETWISAMKDSQAALKKLGMNIDDWVPIAGLRGLYAVC